MPPASDSNASDSLLVDTNGDNNLLKRKVSRVTMKVLKKKIIAKDSKKKLFPSSVKKEQPRKVTKKKRSVKMPLSVKPYKQHKALLPSRSKHDSAYNNSATYVKKKGLSGTGRSNLTQTLLINKILHKSKNSYNASNSSNATSVASN
jgi:hypothetical protein